MGLLKRNTADRLNIFKRAIIFLKLTPLTPLYWSLVVVSDYGSLWMGGHFNICVVYMHGQRFLKHTLYTLLRKNTPKQEFLTILHLILPPKQDFWGNTFGGIDEYMKNDL